VKKYSGFKLEKLMKDTVCEMVNSAPPPPLEESWAKLEQRLLEQHRLNNPPGTKTKNSLSKSMFIAAGIIMIFISLSMSFPGGAANIVENLIDRTQVNVGTQPAPQEDFREVAVMQEKILTLEEAKAAAPFSILIPEYIPSDYNLAQVKYQEMANTTGLVTLKYIGPGTSYFIITEMNTPEGFVQGYGFDTEDAVAQDIKIGEAVGQLISYKNEKIRVNWIQKNIVYGLEGKVPKEDVLKITASMKKASPEKHIPISHTI